MKTETINKIKEALKESGLDNDFQSMLTEFNTTDKTKRETNEDLEDKLSKLEQTLTSITDKLDVKDVKDVDEVIDSVKAKSTEYEVLKQRFDESEIERQKDKDLIIKNKKEQEITKMLADNGVTKNVEHWKKSLTSITTRGEEGQELFVDDKPLNQFIQELANSEDPVDSSRVEKFSKDGEEKLFSAEELANLSQADNEKYMDLVDRSYAAL